MKAIIAILTIITIVGFSGQAYAQNVSNDPVDIKIKNLIAECKEAIQNDDSLSDAQKTVYKRDCVTEITNQHTNTNYNHKLAGEHKAKLENMQKCQDWYPSYKLLTEEQFSIQKNKQVLADCIIMYNHEVWNYVGEDRLDVLVETLDKTRVQSQKIKLETISIPNWLKQNAGWWAQGAIDDLDFASGIEYMIEQKWLKMPKVVPISTTTSNEIPDWVKRNADWWSQGLISDNDFVNGLQHLIKQNVIKIN